MVNVTEAAQDEILRLMKDQEEPVKGVRVKAEALSPLQANYRLSFVLEGQESEDDTVDSFEGFSVYVDPESVNYVQDVTIDFVDSVMGQGFKIENPNRIPPHLKGTITEKVQQIIDDRVNPSISSHGGFITLIDVKDSTAYIKFGGGCQGCGMADVTLKGGVEVMIKESIPEIQEVLDVTEHADGRNPYFQS